MTQLTQVGTYSQYTAALRTLSCSDALVTQLESFCATNGIELSDKLHVLPNGMSVPADVHHLEVVGDSSVTIVQSQFDADRVEVYSSEQLLFKYNGSLVASGVEHFQPITLSNIDNVQLDSFEEAFTVDGNHFIVEHTEKFGGSLEHVIVWSLTHDLIGDARINDTTYKVDVMYNSQDDEPNVTTQYPHEEYNGQFKVKELARWIIVTHPKLT